MAARMTRYGRMILLIVMGSWLNSCQQPTLEAPPLAGQITGESWTYKYANAMYDFQERIFETTLFGKNQTEQDPCSITFTNESYVSFDIPPEIGNYQIPSDIQVTFGLAGTSNETYQAISGFIDVSSANEAQLLGYLYVEYDDQNRLEGTFSFSRCN